MSHMPLRLAASENGDGVLPDGTDTQPYRDRRCWGGFAKQKGGADPLSILASDTTNGTLPKERSSCAKASVE